MLANSATKSRATSLILSHGRAEEIAGIHHSGTIAEADTRALMYFVLEADKLGIQQHAPFLIDCINEYNNDMEGDSTQCELRRAESS
jgi:hypothetical protein